MTLSLQAASRNSSRRAEPNTVITDLLLLWALLRTNGKPRTAEKPPPTVRSRMVADLDGKGRTVILRLDTTDSDPVTLIDGSRRVTFNMRARWKPWSVTTADLDGDGRREIVVAMYKSTRYIPQPHNCLFVYRYDGRQVYPLWLGSTMGRPFTAFIFCRATDNTRDRLVTLDIGLDGRRCLTIHRWTGFGFHKERSLGNWQRADLLSSRAGHVSVLADGKRLDLNMEDN